MPSCISCALTIITFIAYLRAKHNPLQLYVCEVWGWGTRILLSE